jgi:16S rRNA (cytosine967-C5)-methyltransferase
VSTPTAARALALQILRAIDQRQGFSNRILAEHLVRAELSRRDRGLVTALVYGALRHRRRLDALIDGVAHEPRRLSSRVREILRVATLELRELAHPPHAALSQAALLTREIDPSGASGRAVQAILSAIVDRGDALDAALASGDSLDVLELRWSIPRWLAGRWRRLLGEQTALARARALAEPPPIEVRVDLSRTTAAAVAEALRGDQPELEITSFDADPQALRLRGAGELSRHPLHLRGLLSIQALGSQQAAKMLAPRPGERILDACAGMGTKTLQIAEMMARAGEIVAADLSAERIAEHAGLRLRGGLDVASLRLEGVVADLTADHPSLDACAPFDGLLLDAPCTGLGNLARHPELRWARRFEDIAACAELQARLLARCWSRVRAGGRLVYAVCSLEPEEGPRVVEEFCRASGARLAEVASWTPEEHGCDGFFVARLERPG